MLIFQLEGWCDGAEHKSFFTLPNINKNAINVKHHKLGQRVESSCVHSSYEFPGECLKFILISCSLCRKLIDIVIYHKSRINLILTRKGIFSLLNVITFLIAPYKIYEIMVLFQFNCRVYPFYR